MVLQNLFCANSDKMLSKIVTRLQYLETPRKEERRVNKYFPKVAWQTTDWIIGV
jgi:hypothetical protein